MKQRYEALTRDLDWEPSRLPGTRCSPTSSSRASRSTTGASGRTPSASRSTPTAKYQAEKDKRLYAVLDGFAQGQGHLSLTDASYLNAMKLFLQASRRTSTNAHRNFAYLARHLGGPGPRFAALCQSIDEMRHTQTEVHTSPTTTSTTAGSTTTSSSTTGSGTSRAKSFFDDALSAGPFEFLIAIGFSFEYLLTNLLSCRSCRARPSTATCRR